MAEKDAVVAQPAPEPVAWLCEFQEEDGSTRRQFVEQNPEGLRWNDAGVPSPFMTIPLYAHPPTVTLPPLPKAFMVFDPVGEGTTRCTCGEFPHADDCGDVYAPGQMRRWRDQIVDRLRAAGVEVK